MHATRSRASSTRRPARELIFTHGATEGINLVAYAWGLDNLGPGDVVVVTELEHHSNFVPWQYIAKRTGRDFRTIPLDDQRRAAAGRARRDRSAGNVKVVANNLVSNALGTINPIEQLSAWAHERGAIMVVDAAQAAPHHRARRPGARLRLPRVLGAQDVRPDGVGALWGRAELLEAMAPFNLGGHMIRKVQLEETTWGELPFKFEAGTQPIAEAVGFGAAVDYLTEVGLDAIEEHEHELTTYALDRLAEIPGLRRTGPRRSAAPGSSRSTSRTCTRTTSRRSSTGRASRRAGTTAASR